VTVFKGTITSASIDGRTYEVFDAVIGEANAEMSALALGSSFTDLPGSSEAAALAHREEQRRAFSVTLEMQPIGIRGWRMLTTGRPRPPRAATKAQNREARELRRYLVRAAGSPRLLAKFHAALIWGDFLGGNKAVSVPRSLRPVLGRWIGGAW
jgi:hypothetical protein